MISFFSRSSLSMVVLCALALAGCPEETPATDTGTDAPLPVLDAPSTGDAPATDDAPTSDAPAIVDDAPVAMDDAGLPAGFMPLPNCMLPSDYTTDVPPGGVATTGMFTYAPACLIVSAGSTVTIAASAAHPLTASGVGSSGNPIPTTTSNADVTFPDVGFFAYHCENHGTDTGGMTGVIQVVPAT